MRLHLFVVVKSLSCARLLGTPWTVAHQVLLFMEFFRQEYWSGLPFLSLGDLLDPGPCLLNWQVGSLPLSHQEAQLIRMAKDDLFGSEKDHRHYIST